MVESLLNKGGGAVRYRATFLKSAISMSHIEYQLEEKKNFSLFVPIVNIVIFFFYHHPRTCLLVLDIGEGRQRERDIDVRNINWLSLVYAATSVCALTGNQTHDLSLYGMMLQPAEPHQPGQLQCCNNSEREDTEHRTPHTACNLKQLTQSLRASEA